MDEKAQMSSPQIIATPSLTFLFGQEVAIECYQHCCQCYRSSTTAPSNEALGGPANARPHRLQESDGCRHRTPEAPDAATDARP